MNSIEKSIKQNPELSWILDGYSDVGLFGDRDTMEIANNYLLRLRNDYYNNILDETHYVLLIGAMQNILPVRNKNGRRQIGDIVLNSGMEQLIASRIEASEVDITAPNGVWGSIPSDVKKEMTKRRIYTEMTTECTVMCPFCGFAKKGPIKHKIKYENFDLLFGDYREYEPDLYMVSTLFVNNDPFDAKWIRNGRILDYSDVVNLFLSNKLRKRFLYTSTAVPIGEEFRVLRFAEELIKTSRNGFSNSIGRLRFSINNKNEARVNVIKSLLNYFYGDISDNIVFVDNTNSYTHRRAGKKWKTEKNEPRVVDILGVNCFDGIVIRPDGIESSIYTATSEEMPNGMLRLPIIQESGVYVFPNDWNVHDHEEESNMSIIPDIRMTVFESGQEKENIIYYNPHRSFLRIVYAYKHLVSLKYEIHNIVGIIKSKYPEDIKLIKSHLENHSNPTMRYFMKCMDDKILLPC